MGKFWSAYMKIVENKDATSKKEVTLFEQKGG